MQYSKYASVLCAALMASHSGAQQAPYAAPVASKTSNTGTKQTVKKSALPVRKSGLWEVTLRSADLTLKRAGQGPQNAQTVQQCTSPEAEAVMLLSIVPGQENCRESTSKRRVKGGHDIRTVCYVHENRVELQMELVGDLQIAYQGVFSVEYAQTPLNNTGRTAFEGRWLGECKPGQRAGDLVLPNGITVNVVDDKKRVEAGGHEGHDHSR